MTRAARRSAPSWSWPGPVQSSWSGRGAGLETTSRQALPDGSDGAVSPEVPADGADDTLLDEIEHEVIQIWRELLGIEGIRQRAIHIPGQPTARNVRHGMNSRQ